MPPESYFSVLVDRLIFSFNILLFTLTHPHPDRDGPVDGQGQQLAPVCQNVAGWPVIVDDDHHHEDNDDDHHEDEDDNHHEYSDDEHHENMRMVILIFMKAVIMIVIMRVLITTVIQ